VTDSLSQLSINESEESDAEFPKCGLIFGSEDFEDWVKCDQCGAWWDMKCAGVSKDDIKNIDFFCPSCV